MENGRYTIPIPFTTIKQEIWTQQQGRYLSSFTWTKAAGMRSTTGAMTSLETENLKSPAHFSTLISSSMQTDQPHRLYMEHRMLVTTSPAEHLSSSMPTIPDVDQMDLESQH